MAYRKTEKVIAQLEARKALIVGAAADVIAKGGIEALGTDAIAARAGVAVGAIYSFFPDKREIFAAVVASAIERDLDAINEVAETETKPLNAFAAALAVIYSHMKQPKLVCSLVADPAYNTAIREALGELLRLAVPQMKPRARKAAAAAALACLAGVCEATDGDPSAGKVVCTFILGGIGISLAKAERLVA